MIARVTLIALLCFPLTAWGQLQLSQIQASGTVPVGASLDLGSIPAGSSATVTLQVTNISNTAVTVQNVAISGTGFSLPGTYAFELPYVLAPAASWNFKVGFSPVSPGAAQGTLEVNPGISIALSGSGTAALSILDGGNMVAPGTSIDFGRVEMGSSAQQTFTISNPNSAVIPVSTLQVTGPAFKQSSGPAAPFNVQPGASVTIQVAFTPATANAAQGALSINQENFVLTGSGYAQPFPAASIVFNQASAQSGQQLTVSIELASPATAAVSGNLIMTFTPSTPGAAGDNAIQFLSGNPRVAGVTIQPGAIAASFGSSAQAAFQTGTTAGTIGFSLALGNGTQAANSITIAPELVQLNSSTAVAEPGQIVVSLTGFDNTHAASQMAFTFYDSKGNTIAPGTIQTDASQIFATYFSGNEGGGAFALRAAFPVTGDSSTVASARVQITNPAGSAQIPSISF